MRHRVTGEVENILAVFVAKQRESKANDGGVVPIPYDNPHPNGAVLPQLRAAETI